MTPREWCLLEDGAAEAEQRYLRIATRMLSPLISATAGQSFPPSSVAAAAGMGLIASQLLDEEKSSDTANSGVSAQRAAARRYKVMMRKIARRAKKGK